MQVDSKLLDDLARVASGAMGTVFGVRDEMEAQMRQRLERVLARMDVVSREEFEVVRAMAAKAREEQETLERRVADLESRLAAAKSPAPARKAAGKTTAGRTAPRKPAAHKKAPDA
ncbi:accessory factor UbiK family protein [Inquilinus sp. CAU 1745]|uniref:accessory factor UbiK family protein n=1 Tax=Inquilinus sp. CAU 1745 TaxID=3140369 RepID=UPI00325C30C2